MSNKLKPGIIVGLALGIFLVLTSSIVALTKVNLVGCCNCIWPIVGGLLATLWYIKGSPLPARIADGAIIGLLVGVVAGLIHLVIALPIQYFVGGVGALDAQIRQINPNFPLSGMALLIIAGIIGFIIGILLTIIGGIIAVPIFEKRKGNGPVPPAPPQGFGGAPGAGFGSAT
jgi:hypothetical protein